MTDEVAQVGIGITADDKTAKGFAAVEKRAGQSAKRVGDLNRRTTADSERVSARSAKSIVGSMGKIEQAAARAFGGKSLTSGLAGKMGAVGEAAGAMGDGMAGAAAAGGGLAEAAGVVTMAVGGTIAVLAAAAYAAFKFTNNWATGAASLSRTAEIIGVSTKALTEFTAAAERAGVDKGTASGALGSLSQTLNDARYGRNTQALETLRRLGVGMKLNADGTVDTAAMMPAIADALQKQNSSGRRTAARLLGLPEAALPAFTQGGKALAGDMHDADKTAVVIDDRVGATARRIARKGVLVGQMKDREFNDGAAALAPHMEAGYDAVLSGEHTFDRVVHGDFKPAAEKINRASDKMGRAAEKIDGAIGGRGTGAGRLSSGGAIAHALHAAQFRDRLISQFGLSRADATTLAANGEMESGLNPHIHERGGSGGGRGLFQITDKRRKDLFRHVVGKSIEQASSDEQIRFAIWEMGHSEASGWAKARALGSDSAHRAAGYAWYVERPKDKERDASERAAVAAAMDRIPVHVTVELKNAPSGTRATARAGGGAKPAVSRAFQH